MTGDALMGQFMRGEIVKPTNFVIIPIRVVARTKGVTGYRLCTRGTSWGNPCTIEQYGRKGAIVEFKRLQYRKTFNDLVTWLEPLFGVAALGCTCPLDKECHVDWLISTIKLLKSVIKLQSYERKIKDD